MRTNYLFKNQRIPESHLYPNISLEKDILLGTYSLPYWNGVHTRYTTQAHRRREQWWMWNIGAVHPIGINQFI